VNLPEFEGKDGPKNFHDHLRSQTERQLWNYSSTAHYRVPFLKGIAKISCLVKQTNVIQGKFPFRFDAGVCQWFYNSRSNDQKRL